MANKLDTDKKLFLGATAVRAGTTTDIIRKAVSELNTGEGVSYADLETYLLANYKPAKSANYNASFIKSYVRDNVNKFGHLSHEDLGLEYSAIAAPEKAAPAEKPAKAPTKAQVARLAILGVVARLGEVSTAAEILDSKVTIADLVTDTKRKQKTLEKDVEQLEKDGLVSTDKVDDSVYVFLTEAGFGAIPAETTPATESGEA